MTRQEFRALDHAIRLADWQAKVTRKWPPEMHQWREKLASACCQPSAMAHLNSAGAARKCIARAQKNWSGYDYIRAEYPRLHAEAIRLSRLWHVPLP